MSDGWKDIVGQVAPLIGTALGGPAGGIALNFLAEKLTGVDENAGEYEEQIANYVQNGGTSVALELKKLDQEWKVFCKEINLKTEQVHQKDRASARNVMKIVTWPQITISAIFITGYLFVLYQVLGFVTGDEINSDTPEWVRTMLVMLLTLLTSEIPRIMAFWFGSSSGSKNKSEEFKALKKSE